jgi:Flp pilus assembly protein TadG
MNIRPLPSARQRGSAVVELAIVISVMVALAFGVTELGRAIYQYNSLVKATRDAARYLSGQGPGDPADVTKAQCLAVYGNAGCTGSPLVPNLTTAMVSVCDSISCPGTHQNQATGSGVINLVTVTISGYTFNTMVPLSLFTSMAGNSFVFAPASTTMRQIL